MKRVLTVLLFAALAVAVLAFPAAYVLDKAAGRDVILLQSVQDATGVEAAKLAFDDKGLSPEKRREAVVEIYGSSPRAETERVLFVDDAQVIVPEEDRSLALLEPGESHPVQAKSLYFAAQRAVVAAVVAFGALLLLRRFASGRRT